MKNGRISNIREATRIYDVPRTTLRDRLKGIEYKGEKRANNHKLAQFEEESLVKWVLDLDRRGLPPRHSLVRDMANHLLSQHGTQQVGEKWVYNLVQRRPRSIQSSHEDTTTSVLNVKIQRYFKSILTAYEMLYLSMESYRKISIILMRLALLWDSVQLQKLLLEAIDMLGQSFYNLGIENG